MNTPVEHAATWQVTSSADHEEIILRPWILTPEQEEQPAQPYALTLAVARGLERQLADAIRQLEQRSAETPGPADRRRVQQPVFRDRRKARDFQGSPSSHTGPAPKGRSEPPDAAQ